MKLLRNLFLLSVLVAGLASCSKDETTPGLPGTWEGKWGFDNDAPTYYERWEMKKNGDFFAYDDDGDLYATGEYAIDGTVFTAHYTSNGGFEYSFAGTYNESEASILGTWGATPSVDNRGTFEMYK